MARVKKTPRKISKLNDPKTAKFRRGMKKRKNLILDQDKIDRAKLIFGVTTETEAIHRALDAASELVRFREEVESGLPDLVGKGGFTNHFPPSPPNVAE